MSRHTQSNISHTSIHLYQHSNHFIQHITCNICECTFINSQSHSFGQCMHNFCGKCTNTYIDSQLDQQKLIKCPQQKCLNYLDKNSILIRSISQQKQRIYHRIQKHSKNPHIIFCNAPECPGDLTLNPKLSNLFGIMNCCKKNLECNACSLRYCSNCFLASHSEACIITDKIKDEDMVQNIQENYLFKRCGRCSMVVQKRQGCDHIVCKCRFQFCYICGRDYSVHFCTYTERQLYPLSTRVLWTCIYIALMVVLFPLDIAITVLLLMAPLSGLILIIPAALMLGLYQMKSEGCCAILLGNVFLFTICFLSSLPEAFRWYWRKGICNWVYALQYCHFSYFFLKITKMLVYRLPIPCNNRKNAVCLSINIYN